MYEVLIQLRVCLSHAVGGTTLNQRACHTHVIMHCPWPMFQTQPNTYTITEGIFPHEARTQPPQRFDIAESLSFSVLGHALARIRVCAWSFLSGACAGAPVSKNRALCLCKACAPPASARILPTAAQAQAYLVSIVACTHAIHVPSDVL